MKLLLCYLCPPAAVILCGRPFSAVLNVILTCWFWLPGVRHALTVYADWKYDHANDQLMGAIHAPRWTRALHQPQQPQVVYIQGAPQPQYQQPQLPAKKSKAAPPQIDDPFVGANGTVFRRKA